MRKLKGFIKKIEKDKINFEGLKCELLNGQGETSLSFFHGLNSKYALFVNSKKDNSFEVYAAIDSLFTFPVGPMIIFSKNVIDDEVFITLKEPKLFYVLAIAFNLLSFVILTMKVSSFVSLIATTFILNILLIFQWIYLRNNSVKYLIQKLSKALESVP